MVVILLSIMVYQLISIGVRRKEIAELEAQIAVYDRLIEEGTDENEIRQQRWWIERRARELGYTLSSDIDI